MSADAIEWGRQAGWGKYARPERERRFLLAGDPPVGEAGRRIEDRYLEGTRLRLRHVSDGQQSTYKLTQKVRVDERDPAEVRLTNTYLSAEEFALLSQLPGCTITKTRRICDGFAVDTFEGRWQGLRLAEVELDDLHSSLELPSWLGEEVTHDDRFSGGYLAFADDEQVQEVIRASSR